MARAAWQAGKTATCTERRRGFNPLTVRMRRFKVRLANFEEGDEVPVDACSVEGAAEEFGKDAYLHSPEHFDDDLRAECLVIDPEGQRWRVTVLIDFEPNATAGKPVLG